MTDRLHDAENTNRLLEVRINGRVQSSHEAYLNPFGPGNVDSYNVDRLFDTCEGSLVEFDVLFLSKVKWAVTLLGVARVKR